jgi:hypothetical protein
MTRVVAMLLGVALFGPSAVALACGWTCAATHQTSTDTPGCHGHRTDSHGVTIVSAHLCHDVVDATLVQPLPNQQAKAGSAVAARATPLGSGDTTAPSSPTLHAVPPGLAVIPLPLRI